MDERDKKALYEGRRDIKMLIGLPVEIFDDKKKWTEAIMQIMRSIKDAYPMFCAYIIRIEKDKTTEIRVALPSYFNSQKDAYAKEFDGRAIFQTSM